MDERLNFDGQRIRKANGRPRPLATVVLVVLLGTLLTIVPDTPAAPAAATVFETRIASSGDDVEERASGSMRLTSSDLEMVEDNGIQTVGLRFRVVDIPVGATITAAWVQFTADETDAGSAALDIRGEASGSAAEYETSETNLTSRPVTASSVSWSPPGWATVGESGPAQQTPDLTSIVQEIVSRPDWTQGNALAFSIGGSGKRVAESVDGSFAAAPLLHVEYDMSPNAFPTVTITSPTDGGVFIEGSTVTLSGAANDLEDGNLSASLMWSSDVDGPIGTGATVATSTLTRAVHTITATVTDTSLQSVSAFVSIDVEGPGGALTFESRINSGADDAEERANGSVLVGSSDLEMTLDGGGDQTLGLRFPAVTIPHGSQIVDAWVQFTVDETHSGATSLVIRGEASDAAASYVNVAGNITSRSVTWASATWTPAPWVSNGDAGGDQRTPDLSAVVQEIVDRPGWTSGAPLALVIDGIGERVAESFNGSPASAPLLHIEYDDPSNFTPIVTITAPTNGATFTEGDSVSLVGAANDVEDGDISAQIAWTSDVDGALGTGPALSTVLTPASHVITATATDSSLAVGVDSVSVVVHLLNPPSVLDISISSGSDDAEQRTSGTVVLASSDLELTLDGGGPQIIGLRFGGIAVPPDALITAASIQFTVDETNTDGTSLTVRAQAADDAPTFSSLSGSIGSRPRTAASVAWNPAAWNVVGASGVDQRTPDLAALVQELVDRPGWIAGNSIVFVIDGTGERVAESFDGNAGAAALLHLEFVPSPNASPSISISEPLNGDAIGEGTNVTLSAAALDLENGDLSSAITWSSSRDGTLGTGASISAPNLTVGLHTIEASIVDLDGAHSAAAVRIAVESTDPFLIGAGDIADCTDDRDEAVADLIAAFPNSTVYTLGDNAYPNGSAQQFAACYDPSWGSFLPRTMPSVGNHDYFTPGATGYFGYFGAAAGDPAEGWYSYDLGTWHVVVLNSNCGQVGGCGSNSTQASWLAADLAANPAECTLAYWHHPQFSSGLPSNGSYDVFWQILHDAGADVVLSGHSHHYERFALQDAEGNLDPENGIRQFVAGTGGDDLQGQGTPGRNSEVANFDSFGALGLTLHDGSYDWQFIPVEGEAFTDEGSSSCVEASTPVDVRVATGTDDAEERAAGNMLIGSSDLEMTFDAGGDQTLGLRFASVNLPAGATISDAWIQFEVDEVSTAPTTLAVWGEASDQAIPYASTPGNITLRNRTAANVAWDPPAWRLKSVAGPDQRTPDLSSVVQEIVDRPGWTTGSSIAVIIDGSGEGVAESFDGKASAAPLLHIDYTLP